MPEIAGGEVTTADLFRALMSIEQTTASGLASMTGKLDVLQERITAQGTSASAAIEAATKKIDDQEIRIRSLQEARARLFGSAVTLGVIGGALGGWISAHLH